MIDTVLHFPCRIDRLIFMDWLKQEKVQASLLTYFKSAYSQGSPMNGDIEGWKNKIQKLHDEMTVKFSTPQYDDAEGTFEVTGN